MRIFPALMAAFLITVGACKDDVASPEIGRFTVEMNGNSMAFISRYDAEQDDSDLNTMMAVGNKMLRINGYAGTTDGEPDLPTLSMTLASSLTAVYSEMIFIQLFDEDYSTSLYADGKIGQRQIDNIVVGDDGSISFDFIADLVRVTTGDDTPIPGEAGAHIEGSYSGKIPSSELEK